MTCRNHLYLTLSCSADTPPLFGLDFKAFFSVSGVDFVAAREIQSSASARAIPRDGTNDGVNVSLAATSSKEP
jgi:hypothetical protein